jgi:toxin ParE1/3/4
MRVTFTNAARDDLMDIAVYIAGDSPARALTFVDELEHHRHALAATPNIGAPRPELGQDLRVLPHGRYLAFNRDERNLIRILQIMHSARDISGEDIETSSS